MNSYSEEIKFHLPGLFKYGNIYRTLVNLYFSNREMFINNAIIGSIYDSPGGIWNGGRVSHNQCLKEDLISVRDFMANNNIPARFTFTNCLITEKHLNDGYCNMLLDIYNTGNNEIICNSEILENYIRNKCGNNYRYISSTTKRLNNESEQNKEFDKDYYLVVIDYDLNNNYDFLNNISKKEKCEILCNPVCFPNCPSRLEHYREISEAQLEYKNSNFYCVCENKHFWEVQQQSNFIGVDKINDIYIPMGFSNFKLEGRTTPPLDLIEILLYYLIKEEYKPQVRDLLQSSLFR